MPAPLVAFGLVAATVAKGFAGVWFSTRAASPLSEPWRREFLEHSEAAIDKLQAKELATPEWITALRSDLELLKAHVADGWGDKEVFDAACRVAAYLGWKHTTTGMSGVAGLAGSYADHHVLQPLERAFGEFDRATEEHIVKPLEKALDELNRAADAFFRGIFGKSPDDSGPDEPPKH